VTVWEYPTIGDSGGRPLSEEEARPVLSDPRNWWTYDPDDEDDPEADDQPPGVETEPPDARFDLMTTGRAEALTGVHEDPRVSVIVKGYPRSAGPA
jgi:hypothetical protein